MQCFQWTRRAVLFSAVACSLASAGGAAQAAPQTVAYVTPPNSGFNLGLLVDWQARKQARVVRDAGVRSARYTDDGVQRVLTLDSPYTADMGADVADSCGGFPQVHREVRQMVLRRDGGTAQKGRSRLVELGQDTVLDGCDAGQVRSFGNLGDAGQLLDHVDLRARPAVSDLVEGTQLAGLTQEAFDPNGPPPGVEWVGFAAGQQLRFGLRGNLLPYAWTADQWLVLDGRRGFIRLSVDATNGSEAWLAADLVDGLPVNAWRLWVVKPVVGTTFGSLAQSARLWESGLLSGSRTPFSIALYRDQTGERIARDLDAGTESRSPIRYWGFDGASLVQERVTGGGRTLIRAWYPLLTVGKQHFVMEREDQLLPDGSRTPYIAPRINHMIDRGRALP